MFSCITLRSRQPRALLDARRRRVPSGRRRASSAASNWPHRYSLSAASSCSSKLNSWRCAQSSSSSSPSAGAEQLRARCRARSTTWRGARRPGSAPPPRCRSARSVIRLRPRFRWCTMSKASASSCSALAARAPQPTDHQVQPLPALCRDQRIGRLLHAVVQEGETRRCRRRHRLVALSPQRPLDDQPFGARLAPGRRPSPPATVR